MIYDVCLAHRTDDSVRFFLALMQTQDASGEDGGDLVVALVRGHLVAAADSTILQENLVGPSTPGYPSRCVGKGWHGDAMSAVCSSRKGQSEGRTTMQNVVPMRETVAS